MVVIRATSTFCVPLPSILGFNGQKDESISPKIYGCKKHRIHINYYITNMVSLFALELHESTMNQGSLRSIEHVTIPLLILFQF